MDKSQWIERFVSHFAHHGLGRSAESLMSAGEDLYSIAAHVSPEMLDGFEVCDERCSARDEPGAEIAWSSIFYPERW